MHFITTIITAYKDKQLKLSSILRFYLHIRLLKDHWADPESPLLHPWFSGEKVFPLWSPRNLIASSLSLTFLPEMSLSYLMFCKHGLPLKNLSFLVKIGRLVCLPCLNYLCFFYKEIKPPPLIERTRLELPTVRDYALSKSMHSTLSEEHQKPYIPCHIYAMILHIWH